MKRSEMIAWTALVGLLAIAILLLVGGYLYDTTTFWAGMLMAFGQALVTGLAAWGLSLARQRAELQDFTPSSSTEGFRMSYAGESDAGPTPLRTDSTPEIKTLDTSFQRMVVGLTAALLIVMAAGIGYLVYSTFGWAKAHPDLPFPLTRSFDKPRNLDELALVIGLGAATVYCILYWITRLRRGEAVTGEAASSNFTLGVAGMVALGLASIGGYLKVAYSAEIAASIIAALLALQGLELFVNAFRSYSAVEELDEPAIDLQALPLVPMLSSSWLSGLKMLFAQSVGISTSKEKGVIARMMPRAIGSVIIIAILISCLRVVQPGKVAILERLGSAQLQADGKTYDLLQPGLHLTFPWPIDTLVAIPTQELQITDVGTELHADKPLGNGLDFQFWTFRPNMKIDVTDTTDQFVTGGDTPSQQILETYVVVLWRVNDAGKFYNSLSHNEFYEKEKDETTAVPIYEAMVKQCASFSVTRTFAIYTLDEIMTKNRKQVEAECRKIMQTKLNAAGADGNGCGIEVVDLTIKDLHPPLGIGEQPDASQPDGVRRGPAGAYENVVNAMQFKQTRIKQGEQIKTNLVYQATGAAAEDINGARAERAARVAQAKGEATRLTAGLAGIERLPPAEREFMEALAKRQAMYTVLKDVLGPINKIVIDPKIPNVDLYQSGNENKIPAMPRPPG